MRGVRSRVRFGPGMFVAASGIGASDVVASTVAGAKYGTELLWALAIGAYLKYTLTEGIARWQLANGTTLIQGWSRHLPRWVFRCFALYLLLWCIAVSGALVGSCGMAIENLSAGRIDSTVGGMLHAVAAFLLLYSARSAVFQLFMKTLILIMGLGVVVAVFFAPLPIAKIGRGLLFPTIPSGAGIFVLSLIGGVGGSITMLGYNYLGEKEVQTSRTLNDVRRDLGAAFLFTAAFGAALILLAERAFSATELNLTGTEAVFRMASQMGSHFGTAGSMLYSIGFWAAVFVSLIGVWRLVPSIVVDCALELGKSSSKPIPATGLEPNSFLFRLALSLLFLVSLPFAFHSQPTLIVIAFTVLGSIFLPFVAGTLLFLNNQVPPSSIVPKNSSWTNFVLLSALLLFALIGVMEIGVLAGLR